MKKRQVGEPTEEQLAADSRVRFKAHLNCYRYRTALKFTRAELKKALEFVWDELYDMPRAHGEGNVLIVPTWAVALFRQQGLSRRND